jgi:hypothetical protein
MGLFCTSLRNISGFALSVAKEMQWISVSVEEYRSRDSMGRPSLDWT